jgi:hypothetical protein
MNSWLVAVVPVLLAALLAAQGWMARQIIGLRETVAVVKKEVLPNGGSSLKDAVHRVETEVAVLTDREMRKS